MIFNEDHWARLKEKAEEVRAMRQDARPFLPRESMLLVLQVEEYRRDLEGWARLLSEIREALGATDQESAIDAAKRVVREREEALSKLTVPRAGISPDLLTRLAEPDAERFDGLKAETKVVWCEPGGEAREEEKGSE